MKQALIYTKLMIKRVFRALPGIFLMSCILLFAAGLLLFIQIKANASSSGDAKMAIAIVGNDETTYLNAGIETLKNADSSRFSVDFVYMDTENEAQSALESGKISAYVVIPDGFIHSLVDGTNKPLALILGSAQAGAGTHLVSELSSAVSHIITDTQAGIYALQDFYKAYDGPKAGDAEQELNIAYLARILSREDLYEVKTLSSHSSLSIGGYYFCAMLFFFLLLWGNGCSYLYIRRDDSLLRMLKMTGTPMWATILGEYSSLLALLITCLTALSLGIGLAAPHLMKWIPEAEQLAGSGMVLYLLKILPVLFFTGALQMLLMELVHDLISGILLQFLAAACIGYLSGCFYPLSFFPLGVRTFASVLPGAFAMREMEEAFNGFSAGSAIFLMICALGMLTLTLGIRERRLCA